MALEILVIESSEVFFSERGGNLQQTQRIFLQKQGKTMRRRSGPWKRRHKKGNESISKLFGIHEITNWFGRKILFAMETYVYFVYHPNHMAMQKTFINQLSEGQRTQRFAERKMGL